MSEKAPLEIKALTNILDELSYYQLLNVQKGASKEDIKQAYYASSRNFHPDANRDLRGELRSQCEYIAKRITEAYCVLRDSRRRQSYDDQLGEGGNVRIQLAEAIAAHKKLAENAQGTTAQGRQFYRSGALALKLGNPAKAVTDLQMALTFEPSNEHFKEALAEAKAAKKAMSS